MKNLCSAFLANYTLSTSGKMLHNGDVAMSLKGRRTQAVIWVQVTKWYDRRAPPTELSDLNCGGLGIRTPCRTLSPLALPFARPPLAVMVGLAPTFHVV